MLGGPHLIPTLAQFKENMGPKRTPSHPVSSAHKPFGLVTDIVNHLPQSSNKNDFELLCTKKTVCNLLCRRHV